MMAMTQDAFATRRAVQQDIAIWDLIVWAFKSECAQLDHPKMVVDYGHQMVSSSYLICRHEMLGCHIDGGGRSEPHPDADVVASAVAVLSDGVGGWRMATWIAELARVGVLPDWSVPCSVTAADWQGNAHGRTGKVAASVDVDPDNGFEIPRTARGNDHRVFGRCCPVIIRGDASQQARARRSYSQFILALHELKLSLGFGCDLTAFRVTKDMPAIRPWQK